MMRHQRHIRTGKRLQQGGIGLRTWMLVVLILCSGGHSQGTKEGTKPVGEGGKQQVSEEAPVSIEEMKQAIVAKNIFKPRRFSPVKPVENVINIPPREMGPTPLDRPFRVIASQEIEDVPYVYLEFDNPLEIRAVTVDEVIQFVVTILEIRPTYIRVKYDTKVVRIDVGETSNDALDRLKGYGTNVEFEFKGITVTDDASFALFKIKNTERTIRTEVGDWLGQTQVFQIMPDSVALRLANGEVVYLP